MDLVLDGKQMEKLKSKQNPVFLKLKEIVMNDDGQNSII